MPTMPDEHDARFPIDMSELEAIYGARALNELVARARDHLADEMAELERQVTAGAFERAMQLLHRIRGTASFFSTDESELACLLRAEQALRLGDAALVAASLPAARSILAALAHVFEKRLAGSNP